MIISLSAYKAQKQEGPAAFKAAGAADRERALLIAALVASEYARQEGRPGRETQEKVFSFIWELLPNYCQRAAQNLISAGVNPLKPETCHSRRKERTEKL